MVQVVLEGGSSHLERHDLDLFEPATYWLARGERYDPVLDYWDRPMRDVNGWWRYRLRVEHRAMARGYEALRVKP